MTVEQPGRDPLARRLPAAPGAPFPPVPRTATVVGGGIAGLAAAFGLAERGVRVRLIEPAAELGGRVRSWKVESESGAVTMSRGFHAFFRQYYNLRALLSRAGDPHELLVPVDDYPVLSSNGDRDSFAAIPRTPPWNFISFVARSRTFSLAGLSRVDLDAALSLLDVDFPRTFRDHDGVSAAEFLDRLRFPDRARHLALEVFARSFFADPREFSAGELIAMFHSYFLGSAEGLLFDVPRDDFDRTLWGPLGAALERLGVERITAEVQRVECESGDVDAAANRAAAGTDGEGSPFADPARREWRVVLDDGSRLAADGVVLAAGPAATPRIVAASPDLGDSVWRRRMSDVRLAPPFAVWRIWTDAPVEAARPAFLGTAGFGPLDNVTVLERYEEGARRWAEAHDGSVLELHAYALDGTNGAVGADGVDREALRSALREELGRVYPETRRLSIVHEELLVERDCALVGTEPWDERPEVTTPESTVKLAGDWVRSALPIALMERAATTGWTAANELLREWGVAGHDLWSVPTRARHDWPGAARRIKRKLRRGTRS
ncbi:FAD-dependent oxidoreductase [Leucobacter ruminantium]|uniref:FAD-dependent oxidoreductase n=1 Tax=Leucobacter ruminantium TaxID=1289170 RepID=A0A939LWH6_9MICO|nr:FAD-dependent oxidoreductase [Leucobacter ruminantium]MBO1804438.1 FAD-dependent oxidoreductase [Leucobacter ruminantium]